MKPDICTSTTCNWNACDSYHDSSYRHCPKCKYAFYKGEGTDKDGGKLWRWEYRPRHGPNFVTKAGKLLHFQPDGDSPAWELFEKWKKEKGLF